MRLMVNACDVCGAEHSVENPVTVRVSGLMEADDKDTISEVIRQRGALAAFLFSAATPENLPIDLCQQCGGGLIALLRAAHARRLAAQPPAPKVEQVHPSHAPIFDTQFIKPS